MRLSLVSYFDVGESVGLGDEVFATQDLAPEFDITLVGFANPLGRGLLIDLLSEADVVERWREEARQQVMRPGIETGWSRALGLERDEFDARLDAYVAHQAFRSCRLTVYGVGTAYLDLEFEAGVAIPYAPGFLTCFEFAAYRPSVSQSLRRIAKDRTAGSIGRARSGLVTLSRRKEPETKSDQRGYEESRMFSGFTRIILCLENDDREVLPEVINTMEVADDPIAFAYHGQLYFDWASCVIAARTIVNPDGSDGVRESPDEQIARMRACIQIAHVFHGACAAFTELFLDEVREQVGGYVASAQGGRRAQELNQLRTLALAVVSLTNFNSVTPTEEDQKYYERYEERAQIGRQHALIQEACEVVYNVQLAETQSVQSRRADALNRIVLLLTSLTLVSVTVDAYDFVRNQQPIIGARSGRIVFLGAELLLIIGLLVVLTRYMRANRRRGPRVRWRRARGR